MTSGDRSPAGPDTPGRTTAAEANDHAAALYEDYQRTGNIQFLQTAIALLSKAVEFIPQAQPARAWCLSNLGAALGPGSGGPGSRPTWTRPSPICEGRRCHPSRPPRPARCLSNLGVTLQARFERTGQRGPGPGHHLGRQAVDATPPATPTAPCTCPTSGPRCRPGSSAPGSRRTWTRPSPSAGGGRRHPGRHPDRPRFLSNLGNALQARFERTGQQADLDQAITTGRQAVDATPPATPTAPGTCPTSGPRCRPGSSGPGSRRTWTRPSPASAGRRRHPRRPPRPAGYLSNLGAALQARFERTGQQADLDQAITLFSRPSRPPRRPPRPAGYLSNLGTALRTRFERTGQQADLDQAITRLLTAVEATPADHPDRPGTCPTSGPRCRLRFERTGAMADSYAAINAAAKPPRPAPTPTPSSWPPGPRR